MARGDGDDVSKGKGEEGEITLPSANCVVCQGGDKECFPMTRSGRVEHISLPALYRNICREMPGCKVKVLKMSAQATCKQYIDNLDQSK